MESLEARIAALEQTAVQLLKGQQEPLLALIAWASKESVHELGRTRGKLLALEAFMRAAVACAPDRDALRAALETQLQRAEADLLMLRLPEASMPAAAEGLAEAAAALRRDIKDGADSGG